MKKNYLFALGAASMLLMSSCQNDNMPTGAGTVPVKLGVSLPEIQNATRAAFGEGTTATTLYYGVFEVRDVNNDGKVDDTDRANNGRVYLPNLYGTAKFTNLSANVTLSLMPGSTYDIAFWAAAPNAPYELKFDGSTAIVDVHYGGMVSNSENNDGFFGTTTIENTALENGAALNFEVVDAVVLKRPFAQLNIGTSETDYTAAANAGFPVAFTEVEVNGICEVLDLWTGEVSEPTKRTYKLAEIPSTEYTFPNVKGQKYLSMNYILFNEKTTTDVTFKYYTKDNREKVRKFANVPLQRNWRTNIYGELFVNTVGIKVTIAPLFADENGTDDDVNIKDDKDEWYGEKQEQK